MKNKRFTAKILIDIGMTICLLLLMPYSLLSETAHEWIGMAMLVLFIAHHMLNRKWLLSIGKGKYNAFRVIQTVLVIIMFILMMGSMISGILLSNYIFKWIKISGTYMTARQIGDYLIMRMHFVFYDYEKGIFPFLLDYLAVMILIAFIGYYGGLFLKKTGKKKRKGSY